MCDAPSCALPVVDMDRSPPRLEATGLTCVRGDRRLFHQLSLALDAGQALQVEGENGAGKTSLLRILAGETEADLGQIRFGHDVLVGYYAQEHDNLQRRESLLTNMRTAVPPGVLLTETQLRGLLGMVGLSGEKVNQESGTLSGGEKTKLALAMLMVGRR